MAGITKEQVLEFIRNNDLDLDESYPRSDWWKFRDERDAYKKQRDELINDMQHVKRKAEAWIDLKKEMTEMYPVLVIDVETTSGECEKGMLYQLGKHLRRMDELDGTNDFKNLLSDLERGSDE
ncbi:MULTISPECIES: hypothetical protein [Staphylococcus]|uniref:hypothetical protein n=1 Tax=Staphylococcus TaxID=1279 RepID=UPI0025552EF1|nr:MULTISPECIES: hypothetical protein [Staphylococcus]MDK7234220.1 hypothetical protein [Staphylococcus haemolyticus]MEA1861387.1 hypothetical protein [Staphylococcus epidermidis]